MDFLPYTAAEIAAKNAAAACAAEEQAKEPAEQPAVEEPAKEPVAAKNAVKVATKRKVTDTPEAQPAMKAKKPRQLQRAKKQHSKAVPKGKSKSVPAASKAVPKDKSKNTAGTKKTRLAAEDLQCCNHRDLKSFQVWDSSHYKQSHVSTKKNIPLKCSGECNRKFYVGSNYRSVNPKEYMKVTKQQPIYVCKHSVDQSHSCLYALCTRDHCKKVLEQSNDKENNSKRTRVQRNVVLPGEVSRGGVTCAS